MEREHRILSRLPAAFPLAPRSLLLCDDASLIGAPFLVCERRRGITLPGHHLPPNLAADPAFAPRLSAALIDTLADLHRVDPAAVGLDTLGNPDNFLPRQLAGWTKRWHAAHPDPHRDADHILPWLAAHIPASRHTTLLHNDYKLDNLLLDEHDPARPVAVLDWDMGTRGDPLMDLAYLLTYWADPADPPAWIEAAAMPTAQPGFLSRAEAAARYAARTGFDLAPLAWHRVLAAFKLAVILQQIYVRFVRGQTTDPRFAPFGTRVTALLDKAAALTSGGGAP